MEQVGAAVVGTHKLFLQFSCGGAGCGNYGDWTFLFNAVPAKNPLSAGNTLKTRTPGIALVNMATSRGKSIGAANAGAIFDVYGRRLAGAPKGTGLVIVRHSR
jgi:hypothetical protein